jgi:hypothetical protein
MRARRGASSGAWDYEEWRRALLAALLLRGLARGMVVRLPVGS